MGCLVLRADSVSDGYKSLASGPEIPADVKTDQSTVIVRSSSSHDVSSEESSMAVNASTIV